MPPTPTTSLSLVALALSSFGGVFVRWNSSSPELFSVTSDASALEPEAATHFGQGRSSISKTQSAGEASTASWSFGVFIALDACLVALLVLRKLCMTRRSSNLATAEAAAMSEGMSAMYSPVGPAENAEPLNMDCSLASFPAFVEGEVNEVILPKEASASVEPTKEQEACHINHSLAMLSGMAAEEASHGTFMSEAFASVEPAEKTEARDMNDSFPFLAVVTEEETYAITIMGKTPANLEPINGMAEEEVNTLTLMSEISASVRPGEEEEAAEVGDSLSMLAGMAIEKVCKETLVSEGSASVERAEETRIHDMNDTLTVLAGKDDEELWKVDLMTETYTHAEPSQDEEARELDCSSALLPSMMDDTWAMLSAEMGDTLTMLSGMSEDLDNNVSLEQPRAMEDSLTILSVLAADETNKVTLMTEASASVYSTEEGEYRDMDDSLAILAGMPEEKANKLNLMTRSPASSDLVEEFEVRDTDNSLATVAGPTEEKVRQQDLLVDRHLDFEGISTARGVLSSWSYLVAVAAHGDETESATKEKELSAPSEEQKSSAALGRSVETWSHMPSVGTWFKAQYPKLAIQAIETNVSPVTAVLVQNSPNLDDCRRALFQTPPPRKSHSKLPHHSSAKKHDQKKINNGTKLEARFAKVFGKPEKGSPEQVASSANAVGGTKYQTGGGTSSETTHDQKSVSSRTQLEARSLKVFAKPEKVLSKPTQLIERTKAVGEARSQGSGAKIAASGFGSKSARDL